MTPIVPWQTRYRIERVERKDPFNKIVTRHWVRDAWDLDAIAHSADTAEAAQAWIDERTAQAAAFDGEVQFKLPKMFWEDHTYNRDCNGGRLLRELKNQVVVMLDADAFNDLLSDAEYYGEQDAATWDGWDARSLCRSARATKKRLQAGRPDKKESE